MTCVHGMEFSFNNFNQVFHNVVDCGVEVMWKPLFHHHPGEVCGRCVEVFKTCKPLGL